jgi:hypothetical protein|tara:strand:- start:1587 stop:1754 length:168 start_codon:yes stop_codon:yes gene_type:complete
MADFREVLRVSALATVPYAITPTDDRRRWQEYLTRINDELDTRRKQGAEPMERER